MDCYLCDQEATQRCPRCGNPYCSDHGEDPSAGSGQALCADCLNPLNAAPSGTFFRASIFALLLGSVLALWLLIRPPGLPGESSGVIVPEPTPIASPEAITPEPPVAPTTDTPVAEATAEPTPTPTPEPTPEPTPTPEPEGPLEYIMQEGDTISGIADFFGVSFLDILAVNGLTEEEALLLQPGDVLVIPE